jgi:serine/threonine-protein kinase
MAVVWEARDEVLGREVAVKVLAGRHLGDPQSRELIRHEARAAAALSHPNIAQVHDYGETTTQEGVVPFVVMELIRGETLQNRATRSNLPPRFSMRVCAEVAAALAAAHSEGIVHRDVKPANVMLAPTGAKVVDFGIAAAVAPGRTDDNFEVLGTPAYLAPERLLSDVVEPASDVYALAILLYQLLAGCLPWSNETTTQMLTAHIYVDPEPLGPTDGVPDYVVDLVNRCLAKDPTLRPSAREVAAVLAHGARAKVAIPGLDDQPPPAESEAPPPGDAPAPALPLHALLGEAAASTGSDAPSDTLLGSRFPSEAPADSAESADPALAQHAAAGSASARHAAADPASAQHTAPDPASARHAAADSGSAGEADEIARRGAEDESPAGPTPEGRHASLARRWAVAGAALVVLLVAAWLFWPRGDSPDSPAAGSPAVRWQSGPAVAPQPSSVVSGGASTAPDATTPPDGGSTTAVTGPGRPVVAGLGAPPATGPGVPTGTAQPTSDGPTTSPTATASVRELTSQGGSVRATCPGPATAEILSAEPARSYKLSTVDTDPGSSPTAVFKHGNSRVTMTVTCDAGVPSNSDTVS